MNYIEKATNYYLKLLRGGSKVKLSTVEDKYWVTDGYVAHAFPKSVMEINPEIIKHTDVDFKSMSHISKEMTELKPTKIVRKNTEDSIVPFVSDGAEKLTVWFNKKFVDLFPPYSTFYSKGQLSTTVVCLNGDVIGVICPVRPPIEDISLFI